MQKYFSLVFLFFFSSTFLYSPIVFSRDAVSGAEVTGTFTNKVESTFEILALGKGKLQISFSGIYPYKVRGEKMANLGEASGVANIEADTAIFRPEGFEKTCTITIHFTKPGEIQVSQQGESPDCGFGVQVRADGTYRKTISKKPKLDS